MCIRSNYHHTNTCSYCKYLFMIHVKIMDKTTYRIWLTLTSCIYRYFPLKKVMKKNLDKVYDMQLKHWQMSISHFYHELYISFTWLCLPPFCSEIKTSCHVETLLILKPKLQKTHLSLVLRVILAWTQHTFVVSE